MRATIAPRALFAFVLQHPGSLRADVSTSEYSTGRTTEFKKPTLAQDQLTSHNGMRSRVRCAVAATKDREFLLSSRLRLCITRPLPRPPRALAAGPIPLWAARIAKTTTSKRKSGSTGYNLGPFKVGAGGRLLRKLESLSCRTASQD